MELSHFQLPVRYDAHGSSPEKEIVYGSLSPSCCSCANETGVTVYSDVRVHVASILDYTLCTCASVASQCSPHGGSGHSLFTYLPWLAILLHTFRNIPDRSSFVTYKAFGPSQDSPDIYTLLSAAPLLAASTSLVLSTGRVPEAILYVRVCMFISVHVLQCKTVKQ